jgi:hypothetical protein
MYAGLNLNVSKGVINKNDCQPTSDRAKRNANEPADALRAAGGAFKRLPTTHGASVRAAARQPERRALAHKICTTIPTKYRNFLTKKMTFYRRINTNPPL